MNQTSAIASQLVDIGSARKILFLRNSRGITDITGAETYLLTVLTGLRGAGCDVHLMCSDIASKGETAWLRALKERGISHEVIDVPRTLSLSDLHALRERVAQHAPDVIHAMDHRSDALAVWASARSGVPAVASFFGWTNWAKSSLRGRLYPLFDRMVMRRLKKVIVDSAYVGDQIRSATPGSQVAVIQNGVDLARFDAARIRGRFKTEWFGTEDVFLVGMIGRIHPNKGHADMAAAAAELISRHPKLRFVVLGDPPPGYEEFARELKAKIAELKLEAHFKITNIPSAQIPEAYASFDATALPSYMESLSYVMLESMAMQVPVLSARVGGHGALIEHGRNGFLFEPGDVAAQRDLVAQLYEQPELARQVALAGYETVRNQYSTQTMIDRTLAVYDEVIQ